MENTKKNYDYNLENYNPVTIHSEIKKYSDKIEKAQIIYAGEDREFTTENISLDWLNIVDSHNFYIWIKFKLIQKQKYNTQNFAIILRLQLN